MGGTGGRGRGYDWAVEIWSHDTEGHYTAAYATDLDTFKIAHFVADTQKFTKLSAYLGIGEGLNREEPVAITVTPGRIESTSCSIHKNTIECDTTDFEGIAEALHEGIRGHIRRNML